MNAQPQRAIRPDQVRKREVIREFITSAVHDLREPLRAIQTSSQHLKQADGDLTSERIGSSLQAILTGVDRIDSLINSIAEYCYGEVSDLDSSSVDMQQVLSEAQSQLDEELRENDAVITHDALPRLTGDFSALTTVLRNLIDNGCKFRAAASPRIHVGAAKGGDGWLFSVTDNGQGFDPPYAERIFRPFERLHGKRFPGCGLGLPLSRRIVELHGGRLWAESSPGQGSTFWFTLPSER